jgi:hypothetical protein
MSEQALRQVELKVRAMQFRRRLDWRAGNVLTSSRRAANALRHACPLWRFAGALTGSLGQLGNAIAHPGDDGTPCIIRKS